MLFILISLVVSIKLCRLNNCHESRIFAEICHIQILGWGNFQTFLMSAYIIYFYMEDDQNGRQTPKKFKLKKEEKNQNHTV